MKINNFKELEKQELDKIGSPPEKIQKNISKSIGMFRFIGDMVELYVPNLARYLLYYSGKSEHENKYIKK